MNGRGAYASRARRAADFEDEAHEQGDELGEGCSKTPQLTERQTKALLSELTPQMREGLSRALHAQQQGVPESERPQLSPELCRILKRYQRYAGMGPGGRSGESGEEIWPVYLGIVLFLVLAVFLAYIYVQEQQWIAEEEREEGEDAYWLLQEF